MRNLNFGRIALGAVLGTLVGATWLTAAFIAAMETSDSFKTPLSLEMFAIAGAIQFVTIALVFLVFGVPAYMASLILGVRSKVPGIVFGFFLGMIGSLGYGADMHLENLLFGVSVFGMSGIVAAFTFLRLVEQPL